MSSWVKRIDAITLFVDDLEEAKRFYDKVFQLGTTYEDANSAVYRFGDTMINLLDATAVPVLIDPAPFAAREAGVRSVITIGVDDVDAMCERLAALGVALVNGPVDRPWGIRTASFRDPGGQLWELAQ